MMCVGLDSSLSVFVSCVQSKLVRCRSVSPHKQRHGAASRQRYRLLSVFVRLQSTRQHNTRGVDGDGAREGVKLPRRDCREIVEVASDITNVKS